jgi:hypothetical protein
MTETATATKKVANYTDEMVETAISMYQDLGNEGLETIATSIGKNVRSVRSKLVREGVYVAAEKGPSAKRDGPTKKELLLQLEAIAPFEVNGFMGATKDAIGSLIAHFGSSD